MLDVHPPYEKIHGFKDFLLHLLTITIGLLIALSLEGLVEKYHNRELRQEADRNLRQEIQDNRKEVESLKSILQQEEKTLGSTLDFIKAKEQGKPFDVNGIKLGFSIGTLSDASWRTAGATGALALMEYGQVQKYASLYQLQDKLGRLQDQTFDDFLRMQSYVLHGFDPVKFTAADAAAAEPDVRHALAHLVAMDEIGDALGNQYKRVLKGE